MVWRRKYSIVSVNIYFEYHAYSILFELLPFLWYALSVCVAQWLVDECIVYFEVNRLAEA
mgnify:CR=1 FL=1